MSWHVWLGAHVCRQPFSDCIIHTEHSRRCSIRTIDCTVEMVALKARTRIALVRLRLVNKLHKHLTVIYSMHYVCWNCIAFHNDYVQTTPRLSWSISRVLRSLCPARRSGSSVQYRNPRWSCLGTTVQHALAFQVQRRSPHPSMQRRRKLVSWSRILP